MPERMRLDEVRERASNAADSRVVKGEQCQPRQDQLYRSTQMGACGFRGVAPEREHDDHADRETETGEPEPQHDDRQ